MAEYVVNEDSKMPLGSEKRVVDRFMRIHVVAGSAVVISCISTVADTINLRNADKI